MHNAIRIMNSLRTRSAAVATSRAQRAAQQLDEHWYHLRIRDVDLPGKHLLRMDGQPAATGHIPGAEASGGSVTLSEAVSIYIRLKGKDLPSRCRKELWLCHRCIWKQGPDRLHQSGRERLPRRACREGLAGSSMTRVFSTVRSVFNFAASEIGITINNPFAGVYYDRKAGVEDRQPLPMDTIRSLQQLCRNEDDDLRWLVALVSDTGMRLAEAAGLLIDDIQLSG